nr:lipase [Corynebacterium diphtheriae]
MFVFQGTHDGIVPVQQARDMTADWRRLGADVTYVEDPTPLVMRMDGHVRPLLTSFVPAVQWSE